MRDDYKAQASNALPPRNYETATEASALDLARITFQSAADLANRIESLADRLCGGRPVDPSGGVAPISDGVFPALADIARVTSGRIHAANCEIDRIERALN